MAAIWKGSIAFGLVNIPVELRSAVRSDHISFPKKTAAKAKRTTTAKRARKRKTA